MFHKLLLQLANINLRHLCILECNALLYYLNEITKRTWEIVYVLKMCLNYKVKCYKYNTIISQLEWLNQMFIWSRIHYLGCSFRFLSSTLFALVENYLNMWKFSISKFKRINCRFNGQMGKFSGFENSIVSGEKCCRII